MILSVRKKTYEELSGELDKLDDRIVVLACNNCAKKCLGLGGRPGLKSLGDKLEADGFQVLRRELIGFACSVDLIGKRLREEATRGTFEGANTVLALACEDGEVAVENAFPDKKVPKLNATLGIGWASPSAGVRVTHTVAGIELDIPLPGGMPLAEAAERLGYHTGSY